MKKVLLPVLVLVLTFTMAMGIGIANASDGDDWPMFHHDLALSGYTTSSAPSTNTIAWTYDTGSAIHSSPAIVDGTFYIGGLDGKLYARDAYSGAEVWTYTAGGAIYSSPAVAGGNVYFLSTNGNIYALDVATGALNWNKLVGPGSWDWASPAVHGGNVFIASSNGTLYSLNAGTGATNWSTNIGGQPDSPIAVVNGKVYSGTHNFNNNNPTLVALNEADGTTAWTYDYYLYHNNVVGMINSNGVAVVDGKVYFGVYNWQGSDNQTVCLDEATGNELWTANINGNSTSTPAVHDGKVFIGSDDNKLYALNAATGAEIWSYQTGGAVWSAPAVADGKVFFGSLDHWFYALDEDDGSFVWSYYTGTSRLMGSPAVTDGMVFVGNENGKIYAFGPIPVSIDIKPGSYPNSINLGGNGVVPVAILTTTDFDAATVDASTVELAGSEVRVKGKSGNASSLEDVDGDGDLDLVVQVYTESLELSSGDTEAVLTALTYSGLAITGSDSVRIVPPEEEEIVGGPQYGGTLTYFYMSWGDPTTYDIHKALWPSMVFSTPVLDALIVGDVDQYGPVRGTGAYTFPTWDDIPLKYSKGALAESWEVTADQILLHIRPGVLWAAYGKEHVMEVREVTAEDIVFSIHHFIDEGSAEGAPGWLWTENGGFIDSVYAKGDTVVVETSRFDVRWKHWFAAGWCCGFYPPEVFAPGLDEADWMNLVGTGAFMVKEHVLGSYMAYERNPTHWDTAIINGKEYQLPFVDELIYAIIPDESTRIAALRTAKLDIDFGISAVYEETLAQTSPELIKKVALAKPEVMALNQLNPILADYDVRRALIMAVDRETINRAAFGPGGDHNTFPVGSVVPDVYTPFEELPALTQEFLTYNPVKARQILVGAGYPEGFMLTCLLSAGEAIEEDIASMVKAYWEALDVTLTLKIVEGPAYTAMTYGTPLEERVGYDCVIQSDATHLSPLGGLSNAFHPKEVSNLANYVDEYFVERFDYALTIIDDDERNAILKELAVYGLSAAVYLPFGSAPELRYWWPWVKNYYGEKDVGCFYFGPLIARMWIDQDLKAEMGF